MDADYKLVPNWGLSPSTYHLQKLSCDLLGIVNHATHTSTIYLFDERLSPKNTDHTVPYKTHFLLQVPPWIKRLHIFLDNAISTNKNAYMTAWGLEMVQHKKLDFVCMWLLEMAFTDRAVAGQQLTTGALNPCVHEHSTSHTRAEGKYPHV